MLQTRKWKTRLKSSLEFACSFICSFDSIFLFVCSFSEAAKVVVHYILNCEVLYFPNSAKFSCG